MVKPNVGASTDGALHTATVLCHLFYTHIVEA